MTRCRRSPAVVAPGPMAPPAPPPVIPPDMRTHLQPAPHGSLCTVSFETGAEMTLEAITMEGPEARVSDHVARLIATCSRGWEWFFAEHAD